MGWLFGHKDRWDEKDIPVLEGKVAVVTGANSGIGFAAVRQLALHGAHVILGCRNQQRGRDALNKLRTELFETEDSSVAKRGAVELMIVDMGEPESVSAFAEKLHGEISHVDILVNNAGVASPSTTTTDSTGLESQFAINYLGHFQLTALLMDLLEKALVVNGEPARVVNMSSLLHYYAWPFWSIETLGERGKGQIWGYFTSKLAVMLFTFELDRRLRRRGEKQRPSVLVMAAHPGASQTPIFNKYYFSHLPKLVHAPVAAAFGKLPLQTPEMAALPLLFAATAPDAESGGYYGPDGWFGIRGFPTKASSSSLSHSTQEAEKLWAASEKALGITFAV